MKMKIVRHAVLAVVLIVPLLFAGCVIGKGIDPYLVDRTEGWEPKVMPISSVLIYDIDENDSALWRYLTGFTPFVFENGVSKENLSAAMDAAYRLNYGTDAGVIGSEIKVYETESSLGKKVIVGMTDSVVTVFNQETGALNACIDFRRNECISYYTETNVRVTANIADLDKGQLKEFGRDPFEAYDLDDLPIAPDISGAELPLNAKEVFDISVGMNVKKWYGSSWIASTGGAFTVYYAEKSDCLILCTNTYVQAFDRETGELLMMHNFGGTLGHSGMNGTDESVPKEDQ